MKPLEGLIWLRRSDLRGRGGHPEASDTGHQTRDENCSTAAGILVEDGTGPASDEGGAEIWRSVGEAFHPYILDTELLEIEFLSRY
jgi:hypothetical protein